MGCEGGRVAVVTGAAGLIGTDYCKALMRAGHRVVAVDIDEDRLMGMRSDVAMIYACDVTSEESVRAGIAAITDTLGGPDIVITNAGGPAMRRCDAQDLAVADWERVIQINLTSAWLTAKECFPHMAQQSWGRVVNVSSVSAYAARPDKMAAYITAKAGVVGLTRALAREWGPFGITVNSVAPGVVVGGGARHIHSEEQYTRLLDIASTSQSIPGSVEPSDVAGTVVFLASDGAAKITGQTLSVDGGWIFH